MATMATETEPAAAASSGTITMVPKSDEVEYPEGHWIAQSVGHGDAVAQATTALRAYFRERVDVLVAMELVVYYVQGNNTVSLQPDVQVVFGVEHCGERGSFKVWEEGKAPDFVLEVASPSTAGNDAVHKAREYASIGVREYWRLDPAGSLMEPPLQGYEARAGRYEPVQPVEGAGREGVLRSRVLGLDLRSEKQHGVTVLVFNDPRTGQEFDGTTEGAELRRRIAEREKQVAERRASAAERRASAAEQARRAAEQARQAAEQARQAAESEKRAAELRAQALEKRLRALTA